ncbi:C-X-C chemokine receptor type 2-like [Neolamprologus brichardi]|uniref:C-X-C chemokine receptor type 2-like n=1 Tax=Neolamprologus brichardi TaxID=32507 RepID=UPI001643DC44|nr:C-X-C chemokine receptor type 2-like [Neolamprologus brichardi]
MAQFNSTMVTSKISSSPGDSPHPSLDSSGLVPAVVMSICFLMGFPGNVAVIILKPNWENMSSLSQSLMLSLAVSDLLCLVTLPLWIYSYLYGWTFRLVGCKIITYFVYCSLYTSLLTLTVLSVQRYLQVVHLQRSLNRVRAKMLLLPLWLASMILSTPALVFRQLSEDQRWTTCSNQYSFEGGWMAKRMAVVMSETLVGFVSLSVIVFSYINLYRKVSRAVLFNNPQTTRLITSITVTLVVLWAPYLVINVISMAAISLKNEGLLKFCDDSRRTVAAIIFVNSALNPLLYAFTSNRLSSLCHKAAQLFIQKFRFSQTMSTDLTAGDATQ